MDAPEIIYLQWRGGEYEEDNTWCWDQINDDDIEYIRADRVIQIRDALEAMYTEFGENFPDDERICVDLARQALADNGGMEEE